MVESVVTAEGEEIKVDGVFIYRKVTPPDKLFMAGGVAINVLTSQMGYAGVPGGELGPAGSVG